MGADAAALALAWASLAPQVATIPPLSSADWQTLARGDVLRRRIKREGIDIVWAASWTPLPKDALWVAIVDDQHDDLVHGLVEEQLPGTTPSRKLLYQRLDLPWPVADRQWLIVLRSDAGLDERTDHQVWSRRWTLGDPSLAVHSTRDAIWTPINDGGWALSDVGGGTLVFYDVRTDIGGLIPEELVTDWTMSAIDELMGHVLELASRVPGHYVAGHEAILGPSGAAIAPFPH